MECVLVVITKKTKKAKNKLGRIPASPILPSIAKGDSSTLNGEARRDKGSEIYVKHTINFRARSIGPRKANSRD